MTDIDHTGLYKLVGANEFLYYYQDDMYTWCDYHGRNDYGWYMKECGAVLCGNAPERHIITLGAGKHYARSTPLSFLVVTGKDYHEATYCFMWPRKMR